MKTTEFIKESIDQPEYNDEVGMVKNNLHTLVRMSVELAKSLQGNENLPEWCQEKIAVAKSMIVAVGDYMISQHEMGQQPEVDSFDMDRAFAEAMDEAQFGTPGNPELSVKGTKIITPIQGDKVEIKFGYNDYYDTHVTRGEVLQIRPDGMAVVGIDKTGKTEKFPLKSLKVIGPRGYVPGPKDPTYGTPANPELSVKGVAEDAASVKYGVFRKGGSIGGDNSKPIKTFDSKEEAIADAKQRRSSLSKGERGYYRMSYVVKAIKGVAEGGRLDMSSPEERAARKAYIKAHGHPPPLTPDSVVAKYNPENDKKMRDYYLRRKGIPQDKLDKMKEDGVAEAKPDVMRHAGDKTVRVVKRRGKPVGEIGIDAEASPGNGQYYVKLYDGSYDASGFDTAEEALEELKYAMSEGVSEATGDPKFDKMLKDITGKKAVTKQKKADTKQQARDAFGGMFGGNSSDLMKNLKIRESGSLKEDATGGSTGSSSVAVTMQTLGEKGAFSKKEVNKKLGGYTNQLTRGGPVKIGKAK